MIRPALLAAVALAASLASPSVLAQPAARTETVWSNAASPARIPRQIGSFAFAEERSLAEDGTDTILQYRDPAEPRDAATIYVFRASQPNAALWFERALIAITQRPGVTGIAPVGDAQTLSSVDATAPNAMAQAMTINFGDYRTSGLAIAQIGEWIVKIRISRPSEDSAAMTALLREFIGAIGHESGESATVHPLTLPSSCNDAPAFGGNPVPPEGGARAVAVTEGLVVYSRARGREGLAADPAAWCELTPPELKPLASLYRPREGFEGDWTMLVGDAGWSLVSYPLEMPAGEATVGLYANRTSDTTLVGLYDAAPSIQAALTASQPVLIGQSQGLGAISVRPNE